MFQLPSLTPLDLGGGINLVDLGASGDPPDYWKPIAHWINLYGFDPNEAECQRLSAQPGKFLRTTFIPSAIAGRSGSYSLHQTQSIYCWSLLEPNHERMQRYTSGDLFAVQKVSSIEAVTLDEVEQLRPVDIDALKLDTQGLELPILKSSPAIVDQALWIETETGFAENYCGETTFDQVCSHLRARGFALFGLNPEHRVAKKNEMAAISRKEEMLWCEAIWLRDFSHPASTQELTREKALKSLCLYANHGCLAHGLAAAQRFHDEGLLDSDELKSLSQNAAAWTVGRFPPPSRSERAIRRVLSVIPRRWFKQIDDELHRQWDAPNPLRRG